MADGVDFNNGRFTHDRFKHLPKDKRRCGGFARDGGERNGRMLEWWLVEEAAWSGRVLKRWLLGEVVWSGRVLRMRDGGMWC